MKLSTTPKSKGAERLLEAFQAASASLHPQYQEFAPLLAPHLKGLIPDFPKVRLDRARFDWMNRASVLSGRRILELGANTGYFSLRAVSECGATSTVYEPDANLCEIIRVSAEILGIEDRISVRQEGVVLSSIENLPSTDLLINFNVLHHAGREFDKDRVRSVSDWRGYAIEYLSKLRRTAPVMVFQTGTTWGASRERLCPPARSISNWTNDLLRESAWHPEMCGHARIIDHAWHYEDSNDTHADTGVTSTSRLAWAPESLRSSLAKLRRNLLPRSHYRNVMALFAKRPIFLCR
jgi:hypothetical protein